MLKDIKLAGSSEMGNSSPDPKSSEMGKSSPDPKSSTVDGGVSIVAVNSPDSSIELGSQSRSSKVCDVTRKKNKSQLATMEMKRQ